MTLSSSAGRPLLRRILLAVTSTLACVSLARPAEANGRFPAAGHLVASTSGSPLLALETTFGLVVSRGGTDWDWICERAIGYGGEQNATVAVIGDDRILAGFSGGLAISSGGCDWKLLALPSESPLPASAVSVIDIARPTGASTLVLARVREGAADDVGRPALFRTLDNGERFAMVGPPLDPALILETVDVAARDPKRVYLSGVRVGGGKTQGVFLTSDNGGLTFAERTISLAEGEDAPYIAAVDPVDPDRVYVRTSSPFRANRLFVTDDGGETFRVVFSTEGPLLGFALSRDGQTAYLGGPKDGLHRAAASDLAFAKISEMYVGCLASVGTSLVVCATNGLDASDDRGDTFRPFMRFAQLRGPMACAPGASMSVCAGEWPKVVQQLGISRAEDGGPPQAEAPRAPAAPPPTLGSCALDVVVERSPFGATSLVGMLLLALRWRRRQT